MPALDPALTLVVLLATASATLAHGLWGKHWRQLPIFWVAALLGSLVTFVTGVTFPLALVRPAGVPVLECVMVAWLSIITIIIATRWEK